MAKIYDMANRRTQAPLPDGTKWLYGYDRLSQVTSVLSHLRTGKNGHCRASSGGRSVCIRSMRTSPPIQNLLRHCLLFARFHLRQHAGGERVDATTNAPVSGGSFRYAYDGIGNRTTSQEGSSANLLRYSANNLNQYVSIFTPGVIPIRGRADADAKVAVTTTVGGVSTTYLPDRDGQDFSIDIPVDNSSGAVTAAVQVDALKHDGTLDVDLHRRLSGDYTVSAATPEQLTYDADGNMLSYDGWSYTWNAEDRLVSANKGTTRLEFNYDYLGRRFEKKVYENNVLTRHQLFVYDGFKQIAEYDALNGNDLENTYIWQPVGLDVPILRNGQEFYVSDANKNIVALIDTTGTVTDSYIYDPFGNCAHSGSSSNPFQFSSEYFDEETDLLYYNYRYYSPKLGRWNKRDSIEEYGGNNLFLLSNNCIVNTYDALGLMWKIDRTGATKASAISDQKCGESIESLATAAGLLASEFNYWASDVECYCESGEILVKKANVPNTVVALWGGNCGAIGRWWVDWNKNIKGMEALGYHVINITRNRKKNQLYDEIVNRQSDKTLYGIYFWGHGYSPYPSSGLCDSDSLQLLIYEHLNKNPMKYTLNFAYMFACDTDSGRKFLKAINWIGHSGTLYPLNPWSSKWKVCK